MATGNDPAEVTREREDAAVDRWATRNEPPPGRFCAHGPWAFTLHCAELGCPGYISACPEHGLARRDGAVCNLPAPPPAPLDRADLLLIRDLLLTALAATPPGAGRLVDPEDRPACQALYTKVDALLGASLTGEPHPPMTAHDGYAEHSHEVRADHAGVRREPGGRS